MKLNQVKLGTEMCTYHLSHGFLSLDLCFLIEVISKFMQEKTNIHMFAISCSSIM